MAKSMLDFLGQKRIEAWEQSNIANDLRREYEKQIISLKFFEAAVPKTLKDELEQTRERLRFRIEQLQDADENLAVAMTYYDQFYQAIRLATQDKEKPWTEKAMRMF